MTYPALAEEMGRHGCPTRPSALYKIHDPDKPRRITVDELVAIAKVFDLTTDDLLQPDHEWARVVAQELADALAQFDGAKAELVRAALRLAQVVPTSAELEEFVANQFQARDRATSTGQWFADFPESVDAARLERLVELGNDFWEEVLSMAQDKIDATPGKAT